jgi:hypothetical protein
MSSKQPRKARTPPAVSPEALAWARAWLERILEHGEKVEVPLTPRPPRPTPPAEPDTSTS